MTQLRLRPNDSLIDSDLKISHQVYTHTQLLVIFYCYAFQSSRMRFARHVARMGGMKNACKMLVLKSEAMRPLRRPGRRRKDNISSDIREIGWVVLDWIHLAQDRSRWRAVLNAIMNFRIQ
jgi:hypothetical protein